MTVRIPGVTISAPQTELLSSFPPATVVIDPTLLRDFVIDSHVPAELAPYADIASTVGVAAPSDRVLFARGHLLRAIPASLLVVRGWSNDEHAVMGFTPVHRFINDGNMGVICEVSGNAALAVQHANRLELTVLRPGDKTLIPDGLPAVLYAFGTDYSPLLALVAGASEQTSLSVDTPPLVFRSSATSVRIERDGAELSTRLTHHDQRKLGEEMIDWLTDPRVVRSLAADGIEVVRASQTVAVPTGKTPSEVVHVGGSLYALLDSGELVGATRKRRAPGLAEAIRRRLETAEMLVAPQPRQGQALDIVVEGVGDWVRDAYRPSLEAAYEYGARFRVYYANDSHWKAAPDWVLKERHPWERYLDKANPRERTIYEALRPDIVFVVTPDVTHCALAASWLDKARTVFVEKPFDSNPASVRDLLIRMGNWGKGTATAVAGLDHYLFYAVDVLSAIKDLDPFLGGALDRVEFALAEGNPIEAGREMTLQYGLTLDLLPHLLALLSVVSNVAALDEIRVRDVAQYAGCERYTAETRSHTTFWLASHADDEARFRVESLVGKGFHSDAKYLDLIGTSGNTVRLDFTKGSERDGYPPNSAMLLRPIDGGNRKNADDPYHPSRALCIDRQSALGWPSEIPRTRYASLITALWEGTSSHVFALTLTPEESEAIVGALDRVLKAVRQQEIGSYEVRKVQVWHDITS